MIRTYQQALDFLYDNLPMFQRVGAAAYKKDLDNTIRLCAAIGDPQLKFKSIHVAGTNGKGSSSHMIASVLQESGYKTGLYTSPHLKSFTERIRINGKEIDHHFVVEFVNRIRPAIKEIKPSFFEITVAMAYDWFVKQAVDIAVIEVGLGGRLDSTNVITPEVSLITNIGWDHKDILGDTLEKIAFEKAGIIKPHIPVVISERQNDLQYIFIEKAAEDNSPITFASDRFSINISERGSFEVAKNDSTLITGLNLPLKGLYQRKNLAGVLQTLEIITQRGFNVSLTNLIKGLENVVTNTQLKGRWQKLSDRPLVICDTGHNIDGITEVVKQINSISYRRLHLVFGVVKDKDVSAVLSLLPRQAACYFCQAKLPRAMDAYELAEKAKNFGLQGDVIPDVNEARRMALKNAHPDDLIFIGGSTFVVAELEDL
jgi:dihydrofolate synthase / folylpolyglutamate synthase